VAIPHREHPVVGQDVYCESDVRPEESTRGWDIRFCHAD
jgi:hypothetical protein